MFRQLMVEILIKLLVEKPKKDITLSFWARGFQLMIDGRVVLLDQKVDGWHNISLVTKEFKHDYRQDPTA